jgi:hypothetical protein
VHGDNNVTRFDNGIVNDTDGDDAFAFNSTFRTQCLAAGYVFDCNDNDDAFPGAEECDGQDNDCDLLVDEDFFVDSDGDLWPDAEVNATLCGPLQSDGRLRAVERRDQSGRRRAGERCDVLQQFRRRLQQPDWPRQPWRRRRARRE